MSGPRRASRHAGRTMSRESCLWRHRFGVELPPSQTVAALHSVAGAYRVSWHSALKSEVWVCSLLSAKLTRRKGGSVDENQPLSDEELVSPISLALRSSRPTASFYHCLCVPWVNRGASANKHTLRQPIAGKRGSRQKFSLPYSSGSTTWVLERSGSRTIFDI